MKLTNAGIMTLKKVTEIAPEHIGVTTLSKPLGICKVFVTASHPIV